MQRSSGDYGGHMFYGGERYTEKAGGLTHVCIEIGFYQFAFHCILIIWSMMAKSSLIMY